MSERESGCERVQEETWQTCTISTMESWQPVCGRDTLKVRDTLSENDPEMDNQSVKRLIVGLQGLLVKKKKERNSR